VVDVDVETLVFCHGRAGNRGEAVG
jgi:hypothetical protein